MKSVFRIPDILRIVYNRCNILTVFCFVVVFLLLLRWLFGVGFFVVFCVFFIFVVVVVVVLFLCVFFFVGFCFVFWGVGVGWGGSVVLP